MTEDITVHEGMPITTIARTVADLLKSGERVDLIRQAISDARGKDSFKRLRQGS
jgi:hypothetical protein